MITLSIIYQSLATIQGPPGKSIRGPSGPQDPPGPPGATLVSSAGSSTKAQVVIGECGCNETMVEHVVMGLADILPAGDKGETGRPGKPGLTGNTVSGQYKVERMHHDMYFRVNEVHQVRWDPRDQRESAAREENQV